MRVLVTGGAGFVGSHIVDALIDRGDDVVVIDDLSTGNQKNVNHRACLKVREISDMRGGHNDLVSCDAIIHAAAYADLRKNWFSSSERDRLYRRNMDATRHILENKRPEIPILFLSTASVYGSAKNADPVLEKDATPETCESPYAASKMGCEAMIAAYALAHKSPWHIGRLVNVVGARTKHGVIGDFVKMYRDGFIGVGNTFAEKGRIHAADNGRQRKSWVHVSDVANAFLRMLDGGIPNGIYSITSQERISWWDIIEIMGVGSSKVTFEDRAGGALGDPVDLHVSGAKLAPYYRPTRPIVEGIREALDHLGWENA